MRNELTHYGVKGMKWGIRKEAKRGEKRMSKRQKRRQVKKMSDQELRAKLNRVQMERQYSQLTGLTRGKSTTNGILSRFGGQVVSGLIGAGSAVVVKQVINTVKKAW